MGAYNGYIGKANTYHGDICTSQGGNWNGRLICIAILNNASHANAMGVASLTQSDSTEFIMRYDPTTTAGWNSQIQLPTNDIPVSIVISGSSILCIPDSLIGAGNKRYYFGICPTNIVSSGASNFPTMPSFATLGERGPTWIDNSSSTKEMTNCNGTWTVGVDKRLLHKGQPLWFWLDPWASYGGAQQNQNRMIRWWGQATCTINTVSRPTVSAGASITKTNMDNLRTWKSNVGITATAVTQNNSITATIGNTYRATGGAGNKVNASWYNTD